MKKTKSMENIFNQHSKAKASQSEKLEKIYKWIEKQGIDTFDTDFADAIGVRVERDEFDSFDHFFEELERYKNGEDVGYG